MGVLPDHVHSSDLATALLHALDHEHDGVSQLEHFFSALNERLGVQEAVQPSVAAP